MNYTWKIRGNPVSFRVLPDVEAVRPLPGPFESIATSVLSFLSGDAVSDKTLVEQSGQTALSHHRLFVKAGWRFVHPSRELSIVKKMRKAAQIHHVYTSENGELKIGTRLATVQLPADMNEGQVNEALRSDGLVKVFELGFAPNLFEVRVPDGPSYPEAISRLQSNTSRYIFAEPSLLQTITGRAASEDEIRQQLNLAKQWQLDKHPGIDALTAWRITKGRLNGNRPVRIAIIDNGMQISHPDLEKGIIGGGFFDPQNPNSAEPKPVPWTPGMTTFPEKHMNHGTFCMGMAGARLNGVAPAGSAPEADLIAIACAPDQTGTQTTLARAIDFAVNPTAVHADATPEGGADVISCSLDTHGTVLKVLDTAIQSARFGRNVAGKSLGTPIFWAVDNHDVPIASTDPCSHVGVIAVARSDRHGNKSESAHGPRLEFLAPGQDVFSLISDSSTNINEGTSFATPLAAGVAALVLSINPNLRVDELRQLLRDSCHPPGQQRNDNTGFGILNAAQAVKIALQTIPS